jgi:hypothetical protein
MIVLVCAMVMQLPIVLVCAMARQFPIVSVFATATPLLTVWANVKEGTSSTASVFAVAMQATIAQAFVTVAR